MNSSLFENNMKLESDYRKRKLSLPTEESFKSINPNKKHQVYSESNLQDENAAVLQYSNTENFTKIVAKPELLPNTPEIFNSNTVKDLSETSNDFLFNFLSLKSFNTDVKERFSHISIRSTKDKEEKRKEREENRNIRKEKRKERKEKKKERKSKEECFEEFIIDNSGCEFGEKIIENCLNQDNVEKNHKLRALESKTNILEEDFASHIDTYKANNDKSLIFHLQHPSKFSFKGEIKVTVIAGEVETLGYKLNSSSAKNWIEIFSPNFCTSLIVETKIPDPINKINFENLKTKLSTMLTQDDLAVVLAKFKEEDSVLLVEQALSTCGIVIDKYSDKPIFSKDLEDMPLMTGTLKSLHSIFNFQLSKDGKYFRKSPEWDKIPLGHSTVLCGGKGVGKSTLLKYYINKLVSFGEKVLCLDFDPGQSEFTFPGCLSAVIVDKPLLGPNFTHVTDPVVLMYFGDVDVSSDPLKYLQCAKHIIDFCHKNDKLLKMKWFVNTMGFCKGLGIDLMITIIKLLQPVTVIQINGSDPKNNYPFYLTPMTLKSKRGFRSMPLEDVSLNYDLRVIFSCAQRMNKQLKGGLTGRQLRDIMAISYFSRMVTPPFYNLNAVQPYLISFSKLYLGIDFVINFNDILKAFNGNTVSISCVTPEKEDVFSVESGGDTYFKVIVKPSLAPSLGIGFIRGIDCNEKKFYLITHLNNEVLQKVNCLSLGRVSPPHSMFLKQEIDEGRTPYTTLGNINTIQRVKRMFRAPGTPQVKEK